MFLAVDAFLVLPHQQQTRKIDALIPRSLTSFCKRGNPRIQTREVATVGEPGRYKLSWLKIAFFN